MITVQSFAPNERGDYEWQDVETYSSTDLHYAVHEALQVAWEDLYPMQWVDDGRVLVSAFFMPPRNDESRFPVLVTAGQIATKFVAEDFGY